MLKSTIVFVVISSLLAVRGAGDSPLHLDTAEISVDGTSGIVAESGSLKNDATDGSKEREAQLFITNLVLGGHMSNDPDEYSKNFGALSASARCRSPKKLYKIGKKFICR